ncbi:MAG: hypothetical protein QM487_09905, partial [Candidatus Marithrix sp.]
EKPKEDPCEKPKEDPCEKPKEDPCEKPKEDPCGKVMGYKWGWLGALILWFIIFTVLFWLLLFSLKPTFVLKNYTKEVDTGKVLLSAVIAALILVIILWLVRLAVRRTYK